MASPTKTLSALLAKTTVTDHEEILRACTAALKTSQSASSDNLETHHVRFVALLKLDRFEDALAALKDAGPALKEKVKLGRAYALYKIGEFEAAKEIAEEIGGEDRGARHMEAQASYRSEDFAHAAEIYRELQRAGDTAEEGTLRINSGATDAQLEWQKQGHLVLRKSHTRKDLETFETAYNAACGSIARGELVKGEFLLNAAKGLCASHDQLSDAEKKTEILSIQIQQLYVLGRLGKTTEAEKLASGIDVEDIPDAAARQIARNNLIASTSTPTNPYLSHRILHEAPPLPKSDTFFTYQASVIKHNTLAIDLQASKSTAVLKSTARSLAASASPTIDTKITDLAVLNAAAQAQSQLAKLGLKSILPLFAKRPTDIGLAMTIIQLYMLTLNPGAASTVLESLLKNISTSDNDSSSSNEDILYAPGLVALQVSLYTLRNQRSAVKAILAKAASHWRRKAKSTNQQQQQQQEATSLLRAAGLELLSSSNPDHQIEARKIFTLLHSTAPDDKFATAGFIAAHALPSSSSSTAPSSQTQEAADASLPPIKTLLQGINISALEAAGIPSLPSTLPPSHSSTTTTKKRKAETATEKPKKKRIRMSKRPKDFVEGKVPDPERWLPLRERSSYRPAKGKKGKKKQAELTQGGPAEAKKSETGTVVAAPAAGGGVVGGGGSGGGGGGLGKGGKGKKKGKK